MDQLGKESVSQAWRVIVATHIMDGLPDPRNPTDSQDNIVLDMRLSQRLKT